MEMYTDYKTAATWGGTNLVLCNNICRIDTGIWDNIKGEYDPDKEVLQFFITDCSNDTVDWMTETFNLTFAYSEVLNCWILLVLHWGTSWDYVPCEVYSEEWWRINGKKYGFKN